MGLTRWKCKKSLAASPMHRFPGRCASRHYKYAVGASVAMRSSLRVLLMVLET